MTFWCENFRGTRIVSIPRPIRHGKPAGQVGVWPAGYSPRNKMPAGFTPKMAVLLSL
jgi:hypothetical protein